MGIYKTQYIDKEATPEDVVESFGALLHNLNEIMNRLSSDNVKSITTDRTEVKSEDGTTKIDGSQIVMLDGEGRQRMILGYNGETGNFEFSLFNTNGQKTLNLTDKGNAVFSGDIEGSKITGSEIDIDTDAKIGNNLYLGRYDKKAGVKTVQFYDGEGNDLKNAKISAKKDANGYVTFEIWAEEIKFLTTNGVQDGYGNSYVTTTFKPYVEIDGTKYEVKWK